MAGFYWNIGQAVGSEQTMMLTIVGEVINLHVTSSPELANLPVQVTGFTPCVPMQTVVCGPVPLDWLPLSASGYACGPDGQPQQMVPTATSASPTDPHTDGSNPFCDALTHGGVILTTQDGGGSAMTPKEKCDAAQHSPALSAARSAFDSACGTLRSDQSNVAVYTGLAAAMQAAAVAFTVAAVTTSAAWYVALVLGILATIFGALAITFAVLAGEAANRVAADEVLLDSAQQAWQSAIAAVRAACCSAWITINTNDLVCA